MTSFYITGGWGYGNKGDNAILEGMLQSFRSHYPAANLVITSYSIAEMKEQHCFDAVPSVHRLLSIRSPLAGLRWIGVALWRMTGLRLLLVPSLRSHLSAMRQASVVVLGGGGYFNDAWPDMLRSRYVEFDLARAAATPVILYGQTIGPFSDATIAQSLAGHLKRVAMIAYRDKQSLRVLQACGVPDRQMVYTADEANLLLPIPLAQAAGASGLRIGVMVQKFRPHLSRGGPSPAGRIRGEADYAAALVQALTKLAKSQPDANFLFIPSTRWDEPFCKAVFDQLIQQVPGRASMLPDPSARQFIEACQSVGLMISTNMHPVILAATVSAPSVAISYHYKLDDYMASIGLANFVVRIDDFSVDTLLSKCMAALSGIEGLAQQVKVNHQTVKVAAGRNMRAVQDLMAAQTG